MLRDILNDDEFFGYAVDTPRKCTEEHKKREELKIAIGKGKLGKWAHERVDKASDEVINKAHAEYRQRELSKKGEKTEKALGKHVINLYSTGILDGLKSKMLKNYSKTLKMIRSLKIRWLT